MITHHLRLEITDVIKALEEIGENLVNWFSNNEVKLHTDKYICLKSIAEVKHICKASTMIHP